MIRLTLLGKVRAQINRHGLLKPGDRVLVALSGGADSVALLLALLEIGEYTVFAAHVNHMLRGDEAEGDEDFCRELCEKLRVPFFCAKIDVPAVARSRKVSFETAARDERYAFLSVTANKLGAVIATAHTSNDNLETVFFNMGRGCGTAGLCGIPAKRGEVIRPLLTVTRSEIEDYLKEKNQPYRTDSTNLNNDCTRNKIRHNVVPAFLEIFPDGLNKINRMTSLVACDENYIENSSNALIAAYERIGIAAFVGADPAVSSRAALYICEALINGRPEQVHVAAVTEMIATGRGECALPGGSRIVLKNGRLVRSGGKAVSKPGIVPVPLTVGQYPLWDGYSAYVRAVDDTQIYSCVHKNATFTVLPCDILNTAVFRSRLPGDSVTLSRRHVTKPLKKLLNELKIPPENRDRLPLLAVENNVLLIAGTGGLMSDHPAWDPGQKSILVEIY